MDTLCTAGDAAVFQTKGTAVSESAPRHIVYCLKDNAPPVSSYAIGMTQWSRYAAAENLESWTVYVDGTPVRGRYLSCAAGGSLTVKRRAFTIYLH